jgi:gluconate 2-dehydrogenase gamma chain
MEETTRRSVLKLAGVLGLWAVPDWELLAAKLHHAPADESADVSGAASPSFLGAEEMADVEAITALVIPTDTTPGAREAGVSRFIDRALGSFFTPLAAEFRGGLAEFQRAVRIHHPGSESFRSLDVDAQTQMLRSIELTPFFSLVRQLTVLGMFSNPSYGGNRAGIGWQLIGFADQHVFMPPFGHYDRDYPGFQIPGRSAE